MSDLHWIHHHPALRDVAFKNLRAVDPVRYAQTRNHLQGAVTGLSPYITHGLVTLREALILVPGATDLPISHRWIAELGWRSFFRHVWAHHGDDILHSMRPGVLPDAAYAADLPNDVKEARTGVPAIDQAVQTLYTQGMLHNHARMWLASYIVHVRRVHWRTGADWMVAHLMDGDLASNHLSWQWIASTFSSKPYLFNAENVARFAPTAWHSPGSEIDQSHETMALWATNPNHQRSSHAWHSHEDGTSPPTLWNRPPPGLNIMEPGPTQLADLANQDIALIHPWHASDEVAKPNTLRLGIYLKEHHVNWPWTEQRWQWVHQAMSRSAQQQWWIDAPTLSQALRQARQVRGLHDPHIARHALPVNWHTPQALFPDVHPPCGSFSVWWKHISRDKKSVSDLLQP